MKPVIILPACLLSMTVSGQQNEKKYSFYLQGGYKSSLFIKEAAMHTLSSATESNSHKCIVLNTGVQFYLTATCRIGASLTYDHFGTKHRSVEQSNLSYFVRCDRIWKQKRKYAWYSGLMLGVTRIRRFEKETEIFRHSAAGYHIYLVGAEYKLVNNLFIDANAGWGMSGILSLGAKFRF